MPVGDIIQVRFVVQSGTQVSFNVRHYRVSALAAPEATLQQIADFMDLTTGDNYPPLLESGARYLGVMASKVRPLPPGPDFTATASAANGSRSGDPLPKQIAGVLSYRTAVATRRGRGRSYIPFAAEIDNTSSGVPSATYIANLVSLGSAMTETKTVVNGAGGSTLLPVIFHKATGTSDDVTAAVARTVWGTQRRRGDFGRPNIPPI